MNNEITKEDFKRWNKNGTTLRLLALDIVAFCNISSVDMQHETTQGLIRAKYVKGAYDECNNRQYIASKRE